MTPKTLFSIILKIFGLLFIKDIFSILAQILPTTFYLIKPEMATGAVVTIFVYILYLALYAYTAYYLIVKSDLIIEKLKLDNGFDQEPLQFTMHRSHVLAISIIVIGGLLIVEGVPVFLGQLSSYLEITKDRFRSADPPISYMIISGAKIALGFLLIKEKRWIVNFIESQRKV